MAKKTEETLKPKNKYRMVPVDLDTHKRLLGLVYAHGFGRRTQGALVRKLVDAEIEKIKTEGGEKEKKILITYLKE
jgi:hypothetical protein